MIELLILYSAKGTTPNNEFVSADQLQMMKAALSADHKISIAEYSIKQIKNTLSEYRPDLVFNLVYGFSVNGLTIEQQPDSTERLEKMFQFIVGSRSHVQRITQDKTATAEVLKEHDIALPRTVKTGDPYIDSKTYVAKLRFGACQQDLKLINNSEEYNRIAGDKNYIIQEYIDGPEFSIGIIEKSGRAYALPPVIIDFLNNGTNLMITGKYRWYLYCDYQDTYGLKELSIKIFNILKMRDYARIDFRISGNTPILLDVNSLPNIDPRLSLLPLSAKYDGLSYADLLKTIVNSALNNRTIGEDATLYQNAKTAW